MARLRRRGMAVQQRVHLFVARRGGRLDAGRASLCRAAPFSPYYVDANGPISTVRSTRWSRGCARNLMTGPSALRSFGRCGALAMFSAPQWQGSAITKTLPLLLRGTRNVLRPADLPRDERLQTAYDMRPGCSSVGWRRNLVSSSDLIDGPLGRLYRWLASCFREVRHCGDDDPVPPQ